MCRNCNKIARSITNWSKLIYIYICIYIQALLFKSSENTKKMGVFSAFSVFALLVSHVVVINNQVNVVASSSQKNGSTTFELEERLKRWKAEEPVEHAQSQQLFINNVVTTFENDFNERVHEFVQSVQSKALWGKTNIKQKIACDLIAHAQDKYRYLDQNGMDQMVKAINR